MAPEMIQSTGLGGDEEKKKCDVFSPLPLVARYSQHVISRSFSHFLHGHAVEVAQRRDSRREVFGIVNGICSARSWILYQN